MIAISIRKHEAWDGMGGDLPGTQGPYDNPTMNAKLQKAHEFLNRHKKVPAEKKVIIFPDHSEAASKYTQEPIRDAVIYGIHN